MDSDIHFGELEQNAPQRQLRPDQNRHYAVVPCGMVRDEDLPIFVDIDVLRDIESHALSNTKVELGGVLLGGQYEDQSGQPFVVITDSLRAEHYQASKGSFKFTHDTWSDITRKRDEFPPETGMVGWYHTHPGFGVFLSSMDMFICRNFFNKPQDVALVVDPCRGDHGWFQWHGEKKRQMRGYYLFTSRLRGDAMRRYAEQLQGTPAMTTEPSYAGAPGYAPVIHLNDQRSGWLGVGVLATLVVQLCLTMILAVRLLSPAPAAPADEKMASLQEQIDKLAQRNVEEVELRAQRAMLDRVVGQLGGGGAGVVESLETARAENRQLQLALRGVAALEQESQQNEEALATERQRRDELDETLTELKQERQRQLDEIAELKKRINQFTSAAGGGEKTDKTDDAAADNQGDGGGRQMSTWLIILIVVGLLLLLFGIGLWIASRGEKEKTPAPPRGDDEPTTPSGEMP